MIIFKISRKEGKVEFFMYYTLLWPLYLPLPLQMAFLFLCRHKKMKKECSFFNRPPPCMHTGHQLTLTCIYLFPKIMLLPFLQIITCITRRADLSIRTYYIDGLSTVLPLHRIYTDRPMTSMFPLLVAHDDFHDVIPFLLLFSLQKVNLTICHTYTYFTS